ncbi:MAG TPA: hypothetical protein VM695_12365 [Phycisphaerae bacterium]|nr:hypothetical protein [Phycisphaerae bacterium]
MAGQWKEVVRLCFKGQRFRDHALDLSALGELSQFQKLIAETAKAMWRNAHPNRERLPAHFEERTRLCLREIGEGSAVAPLEVWIEQPEETKLFEGEPEEAILAAQLAHEVFGCLEPDEPLPERFPKYLVPEYAKWGQSLAEDEEVELILPGRPPARISPRYRDRFSRFSETPYEATVTVTGEVLEADVRQKRFQLWREDGTAVSVSFTESQEDLVTTALKNHRSVRLRVTGRAEHAASGQLQRFIHVDSLEVAPTGPTKFDATAPAIEDLLASIAAEVPAEEWDRLPADLTDDLDHYVYGTPRR